MDTGGEGYGTDNQVNKKAGAPPVQSAGFLAFAYPITMQTTPASSPQPVKSAERVLAILELFAFRQAPLTLTQIAKALNYPMSSVTMLLKTLNAQGYLSFDADSKCYMPTLSVAMLGNWVKGEAYQDGAVIALMDQIQKDTGETVILGARQGLHAHYLHTVQSQRLMRFYIKPGLLRPLSESAVGRALLMHCSEDELRAYASDVAKTHSLEKHPVDSDILLNEIRRSRERGYAYSDQHTAGICAIALPIQLSPGTPCAIAVAGPIFKLKRRRDKVAEMIGELARMYLKRPRL